MTKKFNLHMISDSSGELLISVANSALKHFNNLEAEEFVWSLVHSEAQIDRIISKVKPPAFVMYTIVNEKLRDHLKGKCKAIKVPCISVLSRVIRELSAYLGEEGIEEKVIEEKLGADYFARIEAINFAIAHDDGKDGSSLEDADIVLVGASRTSKSPTSMYLAYRGYRVANIPFVSGMPLPDIILDAFRPMVMGLTINPKRLMEIRRSRMAGLHEEEAMQYIDYSSVVREVMDSRKIFAKNKWPVIDVTFKSVEEIATNIMQYYSKWRKECE